MANGHGGETPRGSADPGLDTAIAELGDWLRIPSVSTAGGNRDGAPTILIYGHYDVQDAGDESRWTTPPFEPDIRDGRLYARGASDDKGNFLPLLLVACEMADAGELGVNVRILVEGEEETPADTAERWM